MKKRLSADRIKLLIGALSVALFAVVVVPVQTYLSCQDSFSFGIGSLLLQVIGLALVCALVIFIPFSLVGHRLGVLPQTLLVAALVCMYLETSFLSIGLPSINGVSDFTDIIRSFADGCAWLFVFIICILFRRFIIDNYYFVIGGISIMALASLCDSSNSIRMDSGSPLKDGFVPRYDVVMNTTFSTNRNVIVFIIDSAPASLSTSIMKDSPELQKRFPGFVAFEQNLGMHEETALGLPGLMTGKYMDETIGRGKYGLTIYSTNSFLYPYVAANAAVYYSGALHGFGYTNRFKHDFSRDLEGAGGKAEEAFKSPPLFRHSEDIPYLRLFDALCIRLVPHYFKNHFLREAYREAAKLKPTTPNPNSEKFVYSQLAKPIFNDDGLTLALLHTSGFHWPIMFNRKGEMLEQPLIIKYGTVVDNPPVYRRAMADAGYYVLSLLADLMDALQEKGVYANSTIIVAADHGCVSMKEGPNHGPESSILWVKAENDNDEFKFDNAPTSNCKIKDLVESLRTKRINRDGIRNVLSQSKRMYRANWHGATLHKYGGKLHYTDWIYDEGGALENMINH